HDEVLLCALRIRSRQETNAFHRDDLLTGTERNGDTHTRVRVEGQRLGYDALQARALASAALTFLKGLAQIADLLARCGDELVRHGLADHDRGERGFFERGDGGERGDANGLVAPLHEDDPIR